MVTLVHAKNNKKTTTKQQQTKQQQTKQQQKTTKKQQQQNKQTKQSKTMFLSQYLEFARKNWTTAIILSRSEMQLRGKSFRSWCDRSSDRSFMVLFLVPASVPRLVYQRSWYVLFCLWDDAYSERDAHVAAAGFLSRYLNGPLPYVRRHITAIKMLNKKHFLS